MRILSRLRRPRCLRPPTQILSDSPRADKHRKPLLTDRRLRRIIRAEDSVVSWCRSRVLCRMISAALGVVLCVAPLMSQRSCCCADAARSPAARAARIHDGDTATASAASRHSCCQRKAGRQSVENVHSCCLPHVDTADQTEGDCQCPILRRSSVLSATISPHGKWNRSYGEVLPVIRPAQQWTDETPADASGRNSPAPPAHNRQQALLCVWRN